MPANLCDSKNFKALNFINGMYQLYMGYNRVLTVYYLLPMADVL